MEHVTATHAQKNFGALMRKLGRKPVFISQHGETRAVLINVEDWEDLVDGRLASTIEESRDFVSVKDSEKLISSLVKHA